MIERFSAPGSLSVWMLSTEVALKNAGFEHINIDRVNNKIKAERNGPIEIDIEEIEPEKVTLNIQAENPDDKKLFKNKVAMSFQILFKNDLTEEPLGGLPDKYKPREERFKKVYASEGESAETTAKPKGSYLSQDWFILLCGVLCPPLGIYLIWHFKKYSDNIRKIIIGFFVVYTILWGWLLYTVFFPAQPKEDSEVVEVVEPEEKASAVSQISDYWSNPAVVSYMNQMPDLMTSYDNLRINGLIGTPDGNTELTTTFDTIKSLDNAVLGIASVEQSSASYALQLKVNEAAQDFNQTIDKILDAYQKGDAVALEEANNMWTVSCNAFYNINYVYTQAMQAAQNADISEGNEQQAQAEEQTQTTQE